MSVKNNDNVQGLIEQIKKEAIEKSETLAAEIIAEANKKAAEITEKANAEADNIRANAKNDAEKIIKNGDFELQGIARDIMNGLQVRILDLFKNAFSASSEKLLSTENFLAEFFLIAKQKFTGEAIEVSGPEAMINYIRSQITEKDITLKVNDDSEPNFTIKSNGQEFEFTEEEVMAVMLEYCTPKLSEILTKKEEK